MKKQSAFQHLYIFLAFVFLIHFINLFLKNDTLTYIIGFFALIILVVSFFRADRLFKILGITFVLVGLYFFIETEQSPSALLVLATNNLSLLTFFSMLPWMNSVVKSGRYDQTLKKVMSMNVSDLGNFYWRNSATTFTLTAFLNLPAATISHNILLKSLSNLKVKVRNSFINMATLRGYTLALLWSPLEITVAFSILMTGVSYVSILPWLILIIVIAFLLDSVIGYFVFKRYKLEQTHADQAMKFDRKALSKSIGNLVLALISFLIVVIKVGDIFKLDLILTVTLVIFPFCLIWSIFMKRTRRFLTVGWNAWRNGTNNMQNFSVLFISLALFSGTIQDSNFLNFIQDIIIHFDDKPIIIMLLIQFIILFMTMLGVHSFATIGVLTGLIGPLLQIISPLSLAIVFITSAVATMAASPYGLLVTVTSMNTEQNPYRITWQNMPFSLGLGFIGIGVAYLLM